MRLFALLSLITILPAGGSEVAHLTHLSRGASSAIQPPPPQKLDLSAARPVAIKDAPERLSAPAYGSFEFGPKDSPSIVFVILDQPPDKPPVLYVDANLNRDLTDDPAPEWKPIEQVLPDGKAVTHYKGLAEIAHRVGDASYPRQIGFYRFDKNDQSKEKQPLKKSLLYFADYAWTGTATIAGKSYNVALTDDFASGDFRGVPNLKPSGITFRIDRDGDGKFTRRGETFDAGHPFALDGVTYEIQGMTAAGDQFTVVKSAKRAPEIPVAPKWQAGSKILPFEAKTLDGKTVQFPDDFQGKLVLLDFWATWCGPCEKERALFRQAHDKFKDKGLVILGVSLDFPNHEKALKGYVAKHQMDWPQIYDGGGWKAEVAVTYGVEAIPRCLLVDATQGTVLATNKTLRGESLLATLEKAFAVRPAKN